MAWSVSVVEILSPLLTPAMLTRAWAVLVSWYFSWAGCRYPLVGVGEGGISQIVRRQS